MPRRPRRPATTAWGALPAGRGSRCTAARPPGASGSNFREDTSHRILRPYVSQRYLYYCVGGGGAHRPRHHTAQHHAHHARSETVARESVAATCRRSAVLVTPRHVSQQSAGVTIAQHFGESLTKKGLRSVSSWSTKAPARVMLAARLRILNRLNKYGLKDPRSTSSRVHARVG